MRFAAVFKNTQFLHTSSPGGWRFSTSRYIIFGERSVLNETWCSSTEKYLSKRFASVFYLFSHIQLRIIARLGLTGKTVNTWNMSGVLFLSNHASEIHSPNHRVLHVTVFCTARTVSALDFPGNRFTLSLSLNLWDYSQRNTTVHVLVVLPPITGAPVQLSTPETVRGMGTNFQCNDFWDRLGGHARVTYDWWMVFNCAESLYPISSWFLEWGIVAFTWLRRLFLYYLLWNKTSEFHKLKHMNYLLNAENLSQLISTVGRYFGTNFIIFAQGGTPLYKPYRYVPLKGYGLWAFLAWKRVYTLTILVLNRVWFSRDLRECMNVFIVSIPNE